MKPYYDEGGITIYHGDCRETMPGMAASSVDSIVTDPPYGLSFMGKHWDHGVPGVDFWVEALRVAKPGCHMLAFGGTRTFHRLTCAIEDAGWEIRDCVMWVYGSGFPKSHNLRGEWNGYGTALKPAWEPIILARKPLDGTVAENVQEYGTGAMNIDGARVKWAGTKDAAAAAAVGFTNSMKRGTVAAPTSLPTIYNKPAYEPDKLQGRWPANVIHDGSEAVNGMGSASRFFYCAKASKADRDEGCEGLQEKLFGQSGGAQSALARGDGAYQEGENISCGLNAVKARRNNHPTVKPTALMRYLCKLITPPNGTILDPFMGSGSTGKAAALEGFNFIGIETEKDYCDIAMARITAAKKQYGLPLDASKVGE